jgi:hypothetical protein
MSAFHKLIMGRNYRLGLDMFWRQRNYRNLGAMGSGKTTLGAWMIADMARLPGEAWSTFHQPEPT